MEPQDNKRVSIQKAISAHEQAEAALADLEMETTSTNYSEMVERIRRNLLELHAEAARTAPEDHT